MLTLVNIQVMEKAGHLLPRPCFAAHGESRLMKSMSFCLVPVRLAGRAARRGAFLSPRWERNQRIARGTFRKVPRDPSSRPRGAVCPPLDPPASVTWSRYSVQNSRPSSPVQAPGETYASSGRGGMTERLRVITALSETGITTPVRSIPTTAAGGTPPVEGRGAYRCCTRNLRKSAPYRQSSRGSQASRRVCSLNRPRGHPPWPARHFPFRFYPVMCSLTRSASFPIWAVSSSREANFRSGRMNSRNSSRICFP
jgi:hypothetical protein